MIWLLLPAYNEEAALPNLFSKIQSAMESRDLSYEIVIVNDGSYDNTQSILEKYQKELPLHIIVHPINRGLGETERDGFEYIAARCDPQDVIVRVEGDDTHEPDYIFSILKKLKEGFDVVNTSRFQPGGGQKGVNDYRAFVSRAANMFMRLMFGIPGTRDYSCGFRGYRARVIQDAIKIYGDNFVQLRGLGFTSTLEIIVKLHLMGCKFSEVPFVLRYDQKKSSSKMVSSITTLGYFIMAFLYRWPFGGWMSQYRGLKELYRKDPEQAVDRFGFQSRQKGTASRIRI